MSLNVVLYGRPGCCLCDEAETLLHNLSSEFGFVVSKVNIDNDPLLSNEYGHKIPVVTVNGGHCIALRITPERVRRALSKAWQATLSPSNPHAKP